MKPVALLGGGIGDVIIALGVLDAVEALTEPFDIVTDHPDVVWYFKKRRAYKADHSNHPESYDLFLSNMAWLPIEPKDPALWKLWKANQDFIELHQMRHFIKMHPYKDGMMADLMADKGFNRETLAAAMLGLGDVPFVKWPDTPPPAEHPFITIHDGFGLKHHGNMERATKTWDIASWEALIVMIKESFPQVEVVQIGAQTSRRILGADVNYLNRLRLGETFDILSRSTLHIDGDSGMVHAARAMGVQSIVLFGPTPARWFGYEGNLNIPAPVCKPCWWTTDTWMAKCARGYNAPICMNAIPPKKVFDNVVSAFAARGIQPQKTERPPSS